MIASMPRLLLIAHAIAGLAVGSSLFAHEPRERVPMDWKRDPQVAVRHSDAAAPQAPSLPSELAVPPPGEGTHAEPSRAARPTAPGDSVEDAALKAGDEMAREAGRVWGWREYWRAGFARGVTAALDDPRLGAWDREEGLRFGRADRRVRPLGDHLAKEAAAGAADAEAERRVKQQFTDLNRRPERDRTRATESQPPAQFAGPWAMAPTLDQVFASYPFAMATGLSRDGRRALDEWRIQPAYLASRDRQARAYDARWRDPGFAFNTWRDRQGRGSTWSRWPPADRDRFRTIFCDRFREILSSINLRPTYEAWRVGFVDGWRYGGAIQGELAYRQGYAEGFDEGAREAAELAYPYVYDRAYAAAYDDRFDSWWHTAHPGIAAVRVADESDDGVFEPGERVLIEVDVVNFGGGDGAFDVIASGRDLGPPSRTSVSLSGRGPKDGSEKLALRVSPRAALRTRTAVTIALADAREDVPLIVSHPLAFESVPTIEADRIAGHVTIDVAVSNASRRETHAIASVTPLAGAGGPVSKDLGAMPSGGSSEASFTFDGIHPLDLIGGTTRWTATVERDGAIDDQREIRLDPVATDLTNPDLLNFMLAMAGTQPISRADVQDVRALMMERLRADWARAVAADGNPYKRDYETQGFETVLGELVRATHGGKRSFVSPRVFDGLDQDVEALADDLPGAHPLLRKWMKKLAKRVG